MKENIGQWLAHWIPMENPMFESSYRPIDFLLQFSNGYCFCNERPLCTAKKFEALTDVEKYSQNPCLDP